MPATPRTPPERGRPCRAPSGRGTREGVGLPDRHVPVEGGRIDGLPVCDPGSDELDDVLGVDPVGARQDPADRRCRSVPGESFAAGRRPRSWSSAEGRGSPPRPSRPGRRRAVPARRGRSTPSNRRDGARDRPPRRPASPRLRAPRRRPRTADRVRARQASSSSTRGSPREPRRMRACARRRSLAGHRRPTEPRAPPRDPASQGRNGGPRQADHDEKPDERQCADDQVEDVHAPRTVPLAPSAVKGSPAFWSGDQGTSIRTSFRTASAVKPAMTTTAATRPALAESGLAMVASLVSSSPWMSASV